MRVAKELLYRGVRITESGSMGASVPESSAGSVRVAESFWMAAGEAEAFAIPDRDADPDETAERNALSSAMEAGDAASLTTPESVLLWLVTGIKPAWVATPLEEAPKLMVRVEVPSSAPSYVPAP